MNYKLSILSEVIFMQTLNLLIRRFCNNDFIDFAGLIRDKMSSVYAIYDEQFPTDENTLQGILDYFSSSDEFYAVELKSSKKVIGFLTLNNCQEPRTRNFGYCIHTQHQGRGYGTEAVNEIIRYAKNELKLNKLITGTAQNNIPSVGLLLAVGFKKIGESKGSFVADDKGNPIEFIGNSYELILN
jgi:ribosomal-protein-alanine N-acetyltransferase